MTVLIIGLAVFIIILLVILIIAIPRRNVEKQETPYQEALIALLDGRRTDAIKLLRETVMKDTSNIDAYIRLGILIRESGDIEKASHIHQSLTARPALSRKDEIRIYRELVIDYNEDGRQEKSIALLKELVRLAKNKLPYLRELLAFLVRKGRADEIAELLKAQSKLLKNKQELAAWYVELARIYFLEGNEKKADTALKQALKLVKNHPYAILLQAKQLAEKGRYDEAKPLLDKFIKLYPQAIENVMDLLEQVYFNVKLYDKISNIYEKIIRNYPDKREVRLRLADLRAKEGESDEAVSLIDDVLIEAPGDLQFLLKRAQLKINEKAYDEAKQTFEKIEETLIALPRICPECGNELGDNPWFCTGCGSMTFDL